MARSIEGSPETLEEATYLLDRQRLPAELAEAVAGSRTRQQAIEVLAEELDTDRDFDDNYEGMTNDELREELDRRGLATSGNKADLIDRLRENDADPDADFEFE